MKGGQNGTVLFFTLIMLSILSMIVLTQLEMLLMHHQAMNQIKKTHHQRLALETLAQKLLALPANKWSASCMAAGEQDPNQVIKKLTHNKGCVQESFHFLMEALGTFPCIQSVQNHMPYSTQHWRITIMEPLEKMAIQIRFASLINYAYCQSGEITLVEPGIMSWRLWSTSN